MFTIMTNNLLCLWNLTKKYVDDTTALEIIPRNSAILLNFVTNELCFFWRSQNEIEPYTKCKEMLINFMSNHNFIVNPIVIGSNTIKRVMTYKLLGVYVSNDLKMEPSCRSYSAKGKQEALLFKGP